VGLLLRCAFALICLFPATVWAQEPPEVPSSATEPQGFIAEPGFLTRAVLFADRHRGKGDLTNGIYVDQGNMIPGAGWLSVGPGYKHWYKKDSVFVDASAAISVNSYRMAQARVELPKFLKSRLALGASARWQDFGSVNFYGTGPTSTKDASTSYAIESNQFTGYASLRPVRWIKLDGQIGWMNPEAEFVEGPLLGGLSDKRTFVPVETSLTIDTRDFPGHPTGGLVLRGVGAHYDDRTHGTNTFNRYEAEAAGFLPLAGSRIVLALHGWMVKTEAETGKSVPFYLQPSLGGPYSLRAYPNYRFHDNNMLAATAEVRLALMTHLDFAVFADAGNVAERTRDLDLDKRVCTRVVRRSRCSMRRAATKAGGSCSG
jgi:outer membrane protein assembly factor BamA